MADYLEHNVFKRRLDLEGKPIADPEKHEVSQSESKNSTEVQVRNHNPDPGLFGLQRTFDTKNMTTKKKAFNIIKILVKADPQHY